MSYARKALAMGALLELPGLRISGADAGRARSRALAVHLQVSSLVFLLADSTAQTDPPLDNGSAKHDTRLYKRIRPWLRLQHVESAERFG